MISMNNPIVKIIEEAGVMTVARATGVTRAAVEKWRQDERLPRTEATGETHFSAALAKLSKGRYTASRIIKFSSAQWRAKPYCRTGPKGKR